MIHVSPAHAHRFLHATFQILLGGLCLVALRVPSRAQNSDIQPIVHFITLPDPFDQWDLKWVGQTSTVEDELREVILKNAGERTITGIQIGWVLFIPEGCGVREAGVPRKEVHLAPYHEVSIEPGQTIRLGPFNLSSKSIKNFRRHAHSPAVIAQAGVVRTRFADGSETIYTLDQRGFFAVEPAKHPCESYQKSAEAENALETFYGSDFTFEYASLLVPCTKKQDRNNGGYYWVQESCSAYFPVCDDANEAIACIAYPKEKFADTPYFEAAAFSAAMRPTSSEKECLSGTPDPESLTAEAPKSISINGVKFNQFEFGDAGMNQSVSGEMYVAFHHGQCYSLNVSVATAHGSFDGEVNDFSKEDAEEVQSRLDAIRDSLSLSEINTLTTSPIYWAR